MRLPTWEVNLDACMRAALVSRFRYGSMDCVSFAATCVLAITGIDFYKAHRGAYKTASEAKRILSEQGGVTALLDERFSKRALETAIVGDLGINREGAICVKASPGRWVAPGAQGLATTHDEQIVGAWRVG
jgi:hypothetical protein